MITCSRCRKENQDQYKFCLGCGARLETAPQPETAKAPAEKDNGVGALGSAKTAFAPERSVTPPVVAQLATTRAGFNGPAPGLTPFKSTPVVGVAVEGGHRNGTDGSPPRRPTDSVSVVAAEVPLADRPGGIVTPSPVLTAAASAVTLSPVGATPPPIAAAAAGSLASPVAAPGRPSAMVSGSFVAAASPSPGRETIPCPNCGKPVAITYAFCGGCGHRVRGSVTPPPAQRTISISPALSKAIPRGHLTLIRPDGSEGGMHPLHDGENLIGRGQGSLFDADPYLSPRHAEFILADNGLLVRDLRSLNGVFMKITQEERLESGDVFRIGQELLRFDAIIPAAPLEDGTEIAGTPNPGYWGRISVIIGRDVEGPAFPLFDESIVLGRERGDILFPEDGYVSGTHAQVTNRGGHVFISDLGSSNGTFFRVQGTRPVVPGSLLLMGQQLFRVAYR